MSTENGEVKEDFWVVREMRAPTYAASEEPISVTEEAHLLTGKDWAVFRAQDRLKTIRAGINWAVGSRVRSAREASGLSRVQLSDALDVHENTVAKIERGQTSVEAVMLLQIAAMTQRPMMWFYGDTGTAHDVSDLPRLAVAYQRGEMIYVPQFDVRAAAGNGYFNGPETVVAMRAFGQDYIRHTLQIHHDELALVTVVGTSAEPEIHSGDVVLIDRKDVDIRVEGLHLVRIDDGLLVKMVQRLPGGILRVFSKNQRTSPFDINVSEGSHTDFEVLGRVRWGGITFN